MSPRETWSFENTDGLVSQLKARDWKREFGQAHGKMIQDLGPLTAIYHSVGSSTFRAFRSHRDWSPSLVFRSWASGELAKDEISQFLAVHSPDQYQTWAVRLAKSLSKEWKQRLRYDLEIPRALKLVNLLAKGLCLVAPVWPERFEAVVWNIHVPLDKYSLRPLACVPELANLGIRWSNASMGSVKDLKTYARIQKSISDFCERAGVPPLAYDLLAWDVLHDQD